MVVENLNNWLSSTVRTDVDDLCTQLQEFNGHRTVWVDGDGVLWHAEPDDLLEELGHRYVGTFFRPDVDDMVSALAKALPWARKPSASVPRPADVLPAGAAFAPA